MCYMYIVMEGFSFSGSRAVDCLMASKWTVKPKEDDDITPYFPSRADAVSYCMKWAFLGGGREVKVQGEDSKFEGSKFKGRECIYCSYLRESGMIAKHLTLVWGNLLCSTGAISTVFGCISNNNMSVKLKNVHDTIDIPTRYGLVYLCWYLYLLPAGSLNCACGPICIP